MNDKSDNFTPQMSPKEITEKGEKIYNKQLRSRLEKENLGGYVVIDVLSGRYFVADIADEAIALGKIEVPNGIFHLIKIGSPSAFSLGSRFVYQTP